VIHEGSSYAGVAVLVTCAQEIVRLMHRNGVRPILAVRRAVGNRVFHLSCSFLFDTEYSRGLRIFRRLLRPFRDFRPALSSGALAIGSAWSCCSPRPSFS